MTRAAVLLVSLVAAMLVAPSGGERVLVALRAGEQVTAERLAEAGATLVDERLALWETSASTARVVSDAALFVQPVRTYAPTALSGVRVDPLSANEWWRAAIGADGLDPPGPGVPITIVDSGVDFTHPEFAGRPDFTALNAQEPAPYGGEHGTSVASLIGAPENGAGVVGIYPRAVLRSWDAAQGTGRRLDTTEIVGGILTAARLGTGVINLSLGGERDLAIELAVEEATIRGVLVVAASGNSGDAADVALGYPAVLPRVLTVASVDRDDDVSAFSSRSRYVDIAAPGAGILVASAISQDWRSASGTSLAAPLVSGAAAWIWTVRPELDASQVAEVIRLSARDVGPPGRDIETGFGVLNVRAALAFPAPPRDTGEPNDDIEYVDPDGDRAYAETAPLTAPGVVFGTAGATADRWEDPRDLYRVWIPARRKLTVTATASTDVDLALFPSGVYTVVGKPALADRLAFARRRGATERLVFANTSAKGRWGYVVVTLPQGSQRASYVLEARTTR